MRTRFLGSVAAIALISAPAIAADMPVKAPVAPALTSSWAGFYLGAHVGYGYGVSSSSFPGLGATSNIVGLGSRGLTIGGLGGYNFMLGSRWVGSIEGDGNWQNFKTKADAFNPGGAEAEIKMDWSASVRGRLGYLLTPTSLLFASFGWSWSGLKVTDNIFGPPFESFSTTVNGPQVGFGVESVFFGDWNVRSEYLHTFYDRAQFNSLQVGVFTLKPGVDVVRTALIYRFGPSASMPWTDPIPSASWNGFYVGGLIGPLITNAKLTVPPPNNATVDGIGVLTVLPTALVGYNLLIAPQFLVGVEGEIAPNISTTDVKIEWTGGVKLRGGYLFTPTTMVYGSIGWATAGIETLNQAGTRGNVTFERPNALVLGNGVEIAVSDRWRVRADYTWWTTGSFNVTIPGSPPIPANAKATGQTARLGVIYQLGGP